jgi:hypothetical protein
MSDPASSPKTSPNETGEPKPEAAIEEESLMASARRHPIATGTLAASILVGALLGHLFLGEDFSVTRRILGGAVAGGGSWLLVMVGRII